MPHLRALRRFGAATPIPLGRRLLAGSGDLPVTFAFAETKAARTGRPITPPYLALLRAGFACHRRYRRRGALLPHLFTLLRRARRRAGERCFSVPLSVKSPCPGVTRHCPSGSDFPPPSRRKARWPTVVWPTATSHYRMRSARRVFAASETHQRRNASLDSVSAS